MVRVPGTTGSVSNPIDHSDWSGTETKDMDFHRTTDKNTPFVSIYRYINNLDVEVNVDVSVTDAKDSGYSEVEDLRGGNGDKPTLAVPSDTTDSDRTTEPWERIRIKATPKTNPSSGDFEVREFRTYE